VSWSVRLKRRTFLLGALVIGTGGIAMGRALFAGLDARCDLVVRSICDRIIPGHDGVPGALALGIDREVRDVFRERRRNTLELLALVASLERGDFLALTSAEQSAVIRARLAAADETVSAIYFECTRRYLTRTDAWHALGYRTPQPHGYPDYAKCAEA